jgi:hypothetical protein
MNFEMINKDFGLAIDLQARSDSQRKPIAAPCPRSHDAMALWVVEATDR